MPDTFLLSSGNNSVRVTLNGQVTISQTIRLELSDEERHALATFLQLVLFDDQNTARHEEIEGGPAGVSYFLDYSPEWPPCEIDIRRTLQPLKQYSSEQIITISREIAQKLLDALHGNYEDLVREA